MSDELLPPTPATPPEKKREKRDREGLDRVKKTSRELKQEGKEESEELTERAYFAKLLLENKSKVSEYELKLLELYDKSTHRTAKQYAILLSEQRKFIYAQNEVLGTLQDIVKSALTSNVDLVNKYGELRTQAPANKSEEWLMLINGILQIPMLAAIQQAAVLYVTKSTGSLPPASSPPPLPQSQEESSEPE